MCVQVGQIGNVTWTPREVPTGDAVFEADGGNQDVEVSRFTVTAGARAGQAAAVFRVRHLGGEARGDSLVTIVGRGFGNYDGTP
jgi:hypothetical protein